MQIHFYKSGAGQTLLLLHGWGCDHTIFKALQEALSDALEVYALDLPGFGQTPEPEDVWGVEAYANAVEQFMAEHQIAQPAVLGHSHGGRIGIMLAAHQKVSKLILVGSAGIKPRRKLRYYLKVYSYKTLKRLLNLPLLRVFRTRVLSSWANKVGSTDYKLASPMMKHIMSRVVNEDLSGFLPQINVPVLLMWGTNDTDTPLSNAKKMERLIPNAGLVEFPNSGHYSFLENHQQFVVVLKHFLQS